MKIKSLKCFVLLLTISQMYLPVAIAQELDPAKRRSILTAPLEGKQIQSLEAIYGYWQKYYNLKSELTTETDRESFDKKKAYGLKLVGQLNTSTKDLCLGSTEFALFSYNPMDESQGGIFYCKSWLNVLPEVRKNILP